MNTIKKIIKNSFLYNTLVFIKNWIIHIFYPFGYIRNYILFPISGFLRVHHVPFVYDNYKFIDDIRDKYKGKRCFVIATGPSLKIEDMEKLKDEVTIGLNSLYKSFNKTNFRPTCYTVLDPDGLTNLVKFYKEDLSKLAKEYVFLNSICRLRKIYSNTYYLPYCYQNHWFNVFNKKFDHSKNLKFSSDLLYGIYDKWTVTTAAIEIAIHLGCKEIYLLGVDCNYSGPKKYFIDNNASEYNHNEIQAILTQRAMMEGYKFLENESKKRGIRIYNATRGGMLEVFERINFDSIFS